VRLVCRPDDVGRLRDTARSVTALYVGGMGHKNKNFHKEMLIRRGYGDAAERIQELFLAGRREEAIAAMPDEALLQGTLVGSPASIRAQWEAGGIVPPGVTGTIVGADRPDELELIAELTGARDREHG